MFVHISFLNKLYFDKSNVGITHWEHPVFKLLSYLKALQLIHKSVSPFMKNSDFTVCAFYTLANNKFGCFLKYAPQLHNQCYDAHCAENLPKIGRRKGKCISLNLYK
jgi:hypothetical protein